MRRQVKSCGGQWLKRALAAATVCMQRRATEINILNVFPVPDGDTGTNMWLTMQAATKEMVGCPDNGVGPVAQAASYGALMGARGNSGIILSQLFRGFAHAVGGKQVITSADLAHAFSNASAAAYKGVLDPVEGTILTVSKDVAAATEGAQESDNLLEVLGVAVEAARESVAETPNLLPVLRQAGVVDAGGHGLYIILESLWLFARGEKPELAIPSPLEAVAPRLQVGERYGYCTEFLLQGQRLDLETIRAKMGSLGDSVLVVGDEGLMRVHVHTLHPGAVIGYGTSLGTLHRIKIDNMQEQHEDTLAHRAQIAVPALPVEERAALSIVAVVAGEGLGQVFQSLGATSTVPGGQTMNPSTQELLEAVQRVPTDQVILLPNNSNIILAAQQVGSLTSKTVRVVPTTSLPQGAAALLAFNAEADLETNARAMEEAAQEVCTGEVTKAVRAARFDNMEVRKGDSIGLLEGQLVTVGQDDEAVALELLRRMPLADCELITIYFGQEVSEARAEGLAQAVCQEWPHHRVELVDGGQPLYSFIVAAE